MVWLHGALLWNRVLWLSLAVALAGVHLLEIPLRLAPSVARVRSSASRSDREPHRRRRSVGRTHHAVSSPPALHFRALFRLSWLGFVETVKNIYFAVILLAGVIFMVVSAHELGDMLWHADLPGHLPSPRTWPAAPSPSSS